MSGKPTTPPRRYFTMLPNIVDEADLDVYEYRLLGHYYRWQMCMEKDGDTAEATGMSERTMRTKRKSLADKGWITATRTARGVVVKVVDKWQENEAYFTPETEETEPETTPEDDITDRQEMPDLHKRTAGDADHTGSKRQEMPITGEQTARDADLYMKNQEEEEKQKKKRKNKEARAPKSSLPRFDFNRWPELRTDEFMDLWLVWLGHLRDRNAFPTQAQGDMQLQRLSEMGHGRAVAAVRHSIERGWKSIHEPDRPMAPQNDNTAETLFSGVDDETVKLAQEFWYGK